MPTFHTSKTGSDHLCGHYIGLPRLPEPVGEIRCSAMHEQYNDIFYVEFILHRGFSILGTTMEGSLLIFFTDPVWIALFREVNHHPYPLTLSSRVCTIDFVRADGIAQDPVVIRGDFSVAFARLINQFMGMSHKKKMALLAAANGCEFKRWFGG